MHLDTRKMSINPMEIIENGLRLFIDRSSCSSDFQHCIKKFKIDRTLKTSKVFASYLLLILVFSAICDVTDACNSRINFNFRRPRTTAPPPTTTTSSPRPNITYPKYDCPEYYANWYCLNGKCFSIRFGTEITYSCECHEGFIGQRCDYKSTDNSYLTGNSHVETASLTGGAVAVLLLFSVITIFVYLKKHTKKPNEFEVESQRSIERY